MKVRNQEFIKQQIHRLIINPSFIKDVDDFRKRWKIPVNSLKTDQEIEQWHEDFASRGYEYAQEFAKGLFLLVKKYKKYQFGHFLNTFLEFYMKFNRSTLVPLNNATIKFETNFITQERELFIQIWPNTRKKDLNDLWSQIKFWQKRLKEFSGASRKSNPALIERDNYIYQLYMENKTVPQIIQVVQEKFERNTLLTEDQSTPSESAVYKVIERKKSDIK